MLVIFRFIIILCLPVAVLAGSGVESAAFTEPERGSELSTLESDKSSQEEQKKSFNDTDTDNKRSDNESPDNERPANESKASANTTERFVMPVTSWVEDKMHKSSVLNPLHQKTNEETVTLNQSTLRRAILLARESYPGTVLSARKTSHPDTQALLYKVKILSKDGAIREIDVPFLIVHESNQP